MSFNFDIKLNFNVFANSLCSHVHQAYSLITWSRVAQCFQNLVQPFSVKRRLAVLCNSTTIDHQSFQQSISLSDIQITNFGNCEVLPIFEYREQVRRPWRTSIAVTTIVENIIFVETTSTIEVNTIVKTAIAFFAVRYSDFFCTVFSYETILVQPYSQLGSSLSKPPLNFSSILPSAFFVFKSHDAVVFPSQKRVQHDVRTIISTVIHLSSSSNALTTVSKATGSPNKRQRCVGM